MEHSKDVIRKSAALAAFLAIAAAVFVLAPPASRLFVALLALPLETIILATLRGGTKSHAPVPGR